MCVCLSVDTCVSCWVHSHLFMCAPTQRHWRTCKHVCLHILISTSGRVWRGTPGLELGKKQILLPCCESQCVCMCVCVHWETGKTLKEASNVMLQGVENSFSFTNTRAMCMAPQMHNHTVCRNQHTTHILHSHPFPLKPTNAQISIRQLVVCSCNIHHEWINFP